MEGVAGVGADAGAGDIETGAVGGGRREAIDGHELVAGIEGRGVAGAAAGALEDGLATGGEGGVLVGIGRGLEGVDVERQGVELGVAVADAGSGADHVLDEGGVAHEVADGLLANEAGVIEEAAFADTDDVGDLRGEQHAGVGAGGDAGGDGFAGGDEGFERHGLGGAIGIVGEAGDFELLGKGTDAFEEFGGGREFDGAAEHPGALAVVGIVALGARENGPIGHDAGVAGVAAHGAEFDFAFAADDPAGEWDGAVGGDRHAGLFVEGGIAEFGGAEEDGAEGDGRVEDLFAGAEPIGFGLEVGGVEDDLGFLLFEPVHVTGGFAAGVIDGVGFEDAALGELVVGGFGGIDGGGDGFGEGNFEGGDGGGGPGAWDVGGLDGEWEQGEEGEFHGSTRLHLNSGAAAD